MPYQADILVVGCGNILFKDDGFGPAVIKAFHYYLEDGSIDKKYITGEYEDIFTDDLINNLTKVFEGVEIPDSVDVKFIDAGTGSTHFIFSLPEQGWKKVIVVDVVEYNAEPGDMKLFSPYDMPKGKYENAHTWPVEEPLHDLADQGIEVVIVGCKPGDIPMPDVAMGLSKPVENAVPKAVEMILKEIY
ncbi:MAG: coenzyme F420-reducing hydrogenase, FrhD protein [Methanobacteriaceae archaeon]|nr:coenzyme F420-reducing hydrogenase, FrhD protein [Methanobacteriaceae archaeon]